MNTRIFSEIDFDKIAARDAKEARFPRIPSQPELDKLHRQERELRRALWHDRLEDLAFRAIVGVSLGGSLGFLLGASL
jgi:hypothetical protein